MSKHELAGSVDLWIVNVGSVFDTDADRSNTAQCSYCSMNESEHSSTKTAMDRQVLFAVADKRRS